MASNLKSARQAIETELAHARQGAAYYAARVEALEAALQQLESVETGTGIGERAALPGTARTRKGKILARGRRPRATATNGSGHRADAEGASTQRGRVSKRGRKLRADAAMPTTGGEFWLNLVSEQPRSAVDIANAAIETLGIAPDQKEQIQKLKQRVAPALAGLVSAHKIKDSGAGRERRFFKSGQSSAS